MRSQIDLNGKTALVTGAARRLGRAIAMALAAANVRLVLHYHRSAENAETVRALIAETGCDCCLVEGDLADEHVPERIVAQAREAAGELHFLVNNASIFPEGALMTFTGEDLRHNLAINAMAPLLLSRAFVRNSEAEAIVNLLDTRIRDYDRRHVPYHISKRVLADLTRMMAIEFAPRVRVNAVAPGLVLPPAGQDERYLERLAHSNPLHDFGAPEGVAEAAAFLLRAGFVTGQTIYVDGGRHLHGSMYD